MNKRIRKVAATTMSVILTVALLMSATYAWHAKKLIANKFGNEGTAKSVVLHDDFEGGIDKRVYVENTSDSADLFVRIKLQEYMDLTSWADRDIADHEWQTHLPGSAPESSEILNSKLEKYHDHFEWVMGGTAWYIPSPGLDGIVNDLSVSSLTPGSRQTLNAEVVLMSAYKALSDDDKDEFVGWVYDADGWAYWSQPLQPMTATGPLINMVIPVAGLDRIDYFYAINVIMEAVDKSDLPMWTVPSGKNDGYGKTSVLNPFVQSELASNDAVMLLNAISAINTGINYLEVESAPLKTIYAPGEIFDSTGLTLKVVFNDGTQETVDIGFTYSPEGALPEGTTNVVVSYGEQTVDVPIQVTALVGLDDKPRGTKVTIDGISWVKLSSVTDGSDTYVLLITERCVETTAFSVDGSSNDYVGSSLQARMTDFYVNTILTSSPSIKDAAVIPAGIFNTSSPTAQLAKDTSETVDVVFALSIAEGISFASSMPKGEAWWTSTGSGPTTSMMIGANGSPVVGEIITSDIGYRPAVWVKLPA